MRIKQLQQRRMLHTMRCCAIVIMLHAKLGGHERRAIGDTLAPQSQTFKSTGGS